jgi:predicted acylesterase/phospholipase RssA/CRP-like cAMP-binding protein
VASSFEMKELSTAERLRLLRSKPILRGIEAPVLEEIAAALESIHVPGGARIVERGQADVPLFLVVHGGIRASFEEDGGRRQVVFEYFAGSTVAEGLALTGRRAPFDLHAIRDSHLLRLTPQRADALMARHADLSLRFARHFAGRLLDLAESPDVVATFTSATDRLPHSIALLSVGGDDVRRTREFLAAALAEARTATRLRADDARSAMENGGGYVFDSLTDLVVLECDPSDPPWVDFCLRQADRIMVLLEDAWYPPAGEEAAWWRALQLEGRPGHLEVAIVHPRPGPLGQAGTRFADLPGVERMHHVHGADPRDAQRLARWLLDRPVGLVLGGGGAYGIAHVGVLKALEEVGVPVDIVGGTSMGAIFAGGVALQWSADRIMEQVRLLFSSRFALYDPTIPVNSLLAGKKLDRVLRQFFEDLSIGDMWLPFFCVATDISHARAYVQESGNLRDAIRASCSIPGLFPPNPTGDGLLVDGGLVDNLPIDFMGERCPGPIVAVDVFPYERERRDGDVGSSGKLRGWLRHIKPLAKVELPLFDTLMRSTFVGSQRTTEIALTSRPPALRLVPPLTHFGILDWRAYDAIFEAGYTSARRALEEGALPRALWEGRIEDPPS